MKQVAEDLNSTKYKLVFIPNTALIINIDVGQLNVCPFESLLQSHKRSSISANAVDLVRRHVITSLESLRTMKQFKNCFVNFPSTFLAKLRMLLICGDCVVRWTTVPSLRREGKKLLVNGRTIYTFTCI